MPRIAVPNDVREAILDAATRLMERYGYKKMTMEDIAQEAHIGKATIYGYFHSKEEVALSVIHRYQQQCCARWHAIAIAAQPPDVRMRQMLVAHVLFGFEIAQRYQKSIDDTLATLKHLILPQREQYLDALAVLLATVLDEGCTADLFACPDTRVAARTLLTCVSGFSPTNLSPRELGAREEIEARTHQMIDLMLTGLLVRTPSTNLPVQA